MECVRRRYAGQAQREWERLRSTPIARIEYLITRHTLARYLLDRLSPGEGPILDAGCGPGRYAIDLARQGYRVMPCDLLCEMLRLGRAKVREAGVGDRVGTPVAGDLAALPYAGESFAAVLCLGGPLSHLLQEEPRLRAVAEDVEAVRHRRGALGADRGAEKCVDERGLARLDLSHHDEEEELVQVLEDAPGVPGGVGGRVEFRRDVPQRGEGLALLLEDRGVLGAEDSFL